MAFKTITIKKGVYSDLARAKQRQESFSTFFSRLLRERHPSIKEFYGAWELKKGEEKEMAAAMKKFRAEFEESFKRHHESS
ncbi:hypothetical protein HY497_00520 [Candidatus Woesearchaeota archaeon]|nr:hypothetical protein [Candidatus Woesearchaeota archaeon]